MNPTDMLFVLLVCAISAVNGQANNPIGFTVAADASQTFVGNNTITRVDFTSVVSNVGNWYNPNTGVFTAPLSGTYYFGMTAGVVQGEPVSYFLATAGNPDVRLNIGIRNNNTFPNGSDMTSRGILGDIQSGTTFTMVAESGTSLHSTPENHLTSWTMFRYEDISKTLVAFSAVKTMSTDGARSPLIFDEIITNIQNSPFNMSTGTFTVPITGIYFFHMSAGGYPERSLTMNLRHRVLSDIFISCQLTRSTANTNGVDTVSRSMLLPLDAGDEMTIGNAFGSYLYSDDGFQTSFSGLGYALENNPTAVAVFAARRQDWSGSFTLAPVAPWEVVTVNNPDGAFEPASGLFMAPLSGTYFISFGAGVLPNTAVGLVLYRNGEFIAKIERTSTSHMGTDQMSRDVVLDLATSDQLHLEALAGTGLHSDAGLETYFLIMRLKLIQ